MVGALRMSTERQPLAQRTQYHPNRRSRTAAVAATAAPVWVRLTAALCSWGAISPLAPPGPLAALAVDVRGGPAHRCVLMRPGVCSCAPVCAHVHGCLLMRMGMCAHALASGLLCMAMD